MNKRKDNNPCALVSTAAASKDCFGGQQPVAAKQIAGVLNKIPHQKYVEPFLGVGSVYRKVEHLEGVKEVLNDKDCRRVRVAKKRICSVADKSKCQRLKKARPTCNRDWKAVVRKHDSPHTLHYLDPPYEFTRSGQGKKTLHYDHRDVPLADVAAVARRLKGSVAISYSDLPVTRKVLCKKPFRCRRVTKWSLGGSPYTELLAVKTRKHT